MTPNAKNTLMDLPEDIIELILIKTSPDSRRVCRTFRDIVLRNIKTVTGPMMNVSSFPRLARFSLSGPWSTRDIDGSNIVVDITGPDQLPGRRVCARINAFFTIPPHCFQQYTIPHCSVHVPIVG